MTYAAAPTTTTKAPSYVAAPSMSMIQPAAAAGSYYMPSNNLKTASSMVAYPSAGAYNFTAEPVNVAAPVASATKTETKVKAKKTKKGCC
jgi:hypothetical protein